MLKFQCNCDISKMNNRAVNSESPWLMREADKEACSVQYWEGKDACVECYGGRGNQKPVSEEGLCETEWLGAWGVKSFLQFFAYSQLCVPLWAWRSSMLCGAYSSLFGYMFTDGCISGHKSGLCLQVVYWYQRWFVIRGRIMDKFVIEITFHNVLEAYQDPSRALSLETERY